ncbi:MAG: hypothetical protein ACR2IS_04800 [Nitrososphaeraceae archaeon]
MAEGFFEQFSNTKKDNLLNDIEKVTAYGILDEANACLRINISLRSWSGLSSN